MSFWDTGIEREALTDWHMRGERRDMGEYCPVCGYLLAAHLIDDCPTEAEVEAWWGR